MKHLKKIFESSEDDFKYIEECFLDVLENSNFEVDDLLEELTDYPMSVYKLHIEFGKNISLPNPVNSNLYIGMVKTDLDFLRMKNEKISELLNDIEVAINRVGEKFHNSECQIYVNRREEIDIVIIVKNN